MKPAVIAGTAAALLVGTVVGVRFNEPLARLLGLAGGDRDAVAATLESVRQLNALDVLSARLAAVVSTPTVATVAGIAVPGTGKDTTLIAPGDVRYLIDFRSLRREDLSWDPETRRLIVVLADPRPGAVRIDDRDTRVFVDGVTLPFNDKVSELARRSNYDKAFTALKLQASTPALLGLARDAGRVAVRSNLEMPLRTAGVDATVVVRFRSEIQEKN